jgi:Glucose / Sorbosone dehydrogenase
LLGDGSLRELSLSTLTTSPAVDASTIVSQLPAGTFFSSVQGLAFGPEGHAYLVANEDHGSTNVGLVVKGTANGASWTWSVLARTEPYPDSNTPFDHHFNGVVVSPDGRFVYVNSGSRTDHGEVQSVGGAFPNTREVPLTSRLFRLPTTSATPLLLANDEARLQSFVFARGLRNTFDPAFAVDGRLLAADNGPDSDYSEELNWLREGQHFGFPWRLGNEPNAMQFPGYDPGTDPRLRPGYAGIGYYYADPAFPAAPAGLVDPIANRGPDADLFRDVQTGGVGDASALGRTLSTFTAHRSPLGLSFDVAGRLCGRLKQGGFLLSFGAAVAPTPENDMLPDPGRDLLAFQIVNVEGGFEIESRRLVSGFANPIDSLLVGSKLYVLEYGATSRVYELSLPESG